MTGRPDPVEQAGRPLTPARYAVRIDHRRRDPIEYGFSQRSSTWLIDLDEVPELPRGLRRLCRFAAADHLGEPDRSLRENVDAFLAENAVARPARVLMLANPRVLGYVFNPLSVFYCYDRDGRQSHTIAEVHNTYGGRHRYLVRPDHAGRAETDKAFYVSPFYPVDGHYLMRLPEPGASLSASITLYRKGDRPFAATTTGTRSGNRPVGLWSALRSPLATRAVMFGIKRHGITLYLKGLRPFPRSAAGSEPAGPDTTGKITAEPTGTPEPTGKPEELSEAI